MESPRSTGLRMAAAALLTVTALGCALFPRPTPFVLPSPTPGPTSMPPTATPTQRPSVTPSATPTPQAATPTSEPAPPTATTAPPSPSPTPSHTPPVPVRISFEPGATAATVVGSMEADTAQTYALRVSAGQLIDVSVATQQPLAMTVRELDGTLIDPEGDLFFRGTVPTTQDYLVTLIARESAADYALTVIIPARITFAPGGTTAQVEATIAPFTTRHYVIRALAGQTMTLDTTTSQGEVITIVYGADGTVLQTDHAGAPDFGGTLPTTQDYLINLRSVGDAAAVVTMEVTIPPPE